MASKENRSGHLDKSVIYLFLGVFVVSFFTMAFKYIEHTPCEDVTFTVVAPQYQVGELIVFKDKTAGAESWSWNFGDDSEVDTKKSAMHKYDKEGTYEVELTVNKSCKRTETVTILPKKEIKDPTKYPVISAPEKIRVGDLLRVEDQTANASSWEWRFGENAEVDATTRQAQYRYTKPGLKTIRLVVNGDANYVGTAYIEVQPKPQVNTATSFIKNKPKQYESSIKNKPEEENSFIKKTPEEKELEVPFISNADFSSMIVQVAKEQIQPQAFKDFFCGDLNKSIVVNGKTTTFLEFCSKIKGKKKLKVKEVNLFRADDNSNCITNVVIEHKKLGWF